MRALTVARDRQKNRWVRRNSKIGLNIVLAVFEHPKMIPLATPKHADRENPTVIHFAQPELYAGFKAYFDQLWNQESYVLKGPKAL